MRLRKTLPNRFAVYVLALLLASVWFVPGARAADPLVYHFPIGSSKTLRLDSGALLGVNPGVITVESDITWKVLADPVPTLPDGYVVIGSAYQLSIAGQPALDPVILHPLAVALPAERGEWRRELWQYDIQSQAWTKLVAGWNKPNQQFRATVRTMNAFLAVLEQSGIQQGNATWYCKKSCSPRYPTLHATSNDFPIGSYVRVTNPANNKTVTVKIISRWGKPAGRVIDLSWAAYAALKPTNAGVTPVTVQAAKPPTTPPPIPDTVIETAEVIPALTVSKAKPTPAPSVAAVSYSVIDQGTGTVLAESNADHQASIASLTKLMTAMVFLDTNPKLSSLIKYSKFDATPYGYLRLRYGDSASLRDFLGSTLVGSANNAATVLARSTGLTRQAFIDHMNAKAASWGLIHTRFVDVHGLGDGNMSTSREYAVLASHAFHEYPIIRALSTKTSYRFTTRNTKIVHTIKTTDKLLTQKRSFRMTGSKTGFTDEALYTYAVRAKTPAGGQVLTVVFGAPTSSARFQGGAALTTWALDTFQWSANG